MASAMLPETLDDFSRVSVSRTAISACNAMPTAAGATSA
jgi:hypothetical protein